MQLDTTERHIMENRGSRHTLIIRKVHPQDFGNYSCVGTYKKMGFFLLSSSISLSLLTCVCSKKQVGSIRNDIKLFVYSCVAENPLGKTRKTVQLTGKPNTANFRSAPVSQYKDRYVFEKKKTFSFLSIPCKS